MKSNNMFSKKYPEKDGIRVYTKIRTWSEERKNEYVMRKWEPINKTAEEISNV